MLCLMGTKELLPSDTVAIESPNFLPRHQEAVKVCKEKYTQSVVPYMLVSSLHYPRIQARFVVKYFFIAVSE